MASLSTLSYSGAPAEPSSDRERLILEHLPQVRWVATRIHEKLPDLHFSGRPDFHRHCLV